MYSIQFARSKAPWESAQANLENKNVSAARERSYNAALIWEKGLIGEEIWVSVTYCKGQRKGKKLKTHEDFANSDPQQTQRQGGCVSSNGSATGARRLF